MSPGASPFARSVSCLFPEKPVETAFVLKSEIIGYLLYCHCLRGQDEFFPFFYPQPVLPFPEADIRVFGEISFQVSLVNSGFICENPEGEVPHYVPVIYSPFFQNPLNPLVFREFFAFRDRVAGSLRRLSGKSHADLAVNAEYHQFHLVRNLFHATVHNQSGDNTKQGTANFLTIPLIISVICQRRLTSRARMRKSAVPRWWRLTPR